MSDLRELSLSEIGGFLDLSRSRVYQLEQEGQLRGRSWQDIGACALRRAIEQAQQVQRQANRVARAINKRPRSRRYELTALAAQVEQLQTATLAIGTITMARRKAEAELTDEITSGIAWKPLVGLYEVSNQGQIRHVRFKRVRRPGRVGRTKYLQVLLTVAGRRKNVLIHRAVLEAFVGPCPAGCQARHLNGDEHDNRLSNLAWGTPLENAQDKHRHGRTPRGETVHNSKLSDDAVRAIRASTEPQRELAKRYGVTQTNISRVQRRMAWSHVD